MLEVGIDDEVVCANDDSADDDTTAAVGSANGSCFTAIALAEEVDGDGIGDEEDFENSSFVGARPIPGATFGVEMPAPVVEALDVSLLEESCRRGVVTPSAVEAVDAAIELAPIGPAWPVRMLAENGGKTKCEPWASRVEAVQKSVYSRGERRKK